LSAGLDKLAERLKNEGVPENELIVDFTSGQKPNTMAAAMMTSNKRVFAQYVQTNHPWEILEYDLVTGAQQPNPEAWPLRLSILLLTNQFAQIPRANLSNTACVLPFMDTKLLDIKFARIGARLKLADRPARRSRTTGIISLDVHTDRKGEYFEIVRQSEADAEIAVLDVQPADRHLLLLVREGKDKSKFLCGHDERHWFIAGIPEKAPVGTVRQAKEALKPAEVLSAQAGKRLRAKARNRRKNAAFIRQGEWFFVQVPSFVVDEKLVLRNEPLRRGNGGKPHWTEFCYRTGGETVYVCSRHPNGVTESQYKSILANSPKAKGWGWRTMSRNPGVYVRGRVRHADHATITLHSWHRVLMNTEGQSKAMKNVAFLD
jgi:hypothetical protein